MVLVCCKFCDGDIQHLSACKSEFQSYSGVSGSLVVSLLCMSRAAVSLVQFWLSLSL